MKIHHIVCGLALVAAVSCVPVSREIDRNNTEVVVVPLESQPGIFSLEDGVVDTGFPGGFFSFNPFGNPFGGFMQSMEDMMTRLRNQMSQVLHRLPPDNVDWKEIGEGKGNTTSTTKIIDGHKVTINETTYTNDGDNSGSIFKIRIVDVHPASEEDTSVEKVDEKPVVKAPKEAEETTPKSKKEQTNSSPELMEDNEIPRTKKETDNPMDDEIETLGEDFYTKSGVQPDESMQSIIISNPDAESNEIDSYGHLHDIETNDVDFEPIDLSNDILVNQMLADVDAPHNPDAEIITVEENERSPILNRPYFQPMRFDDPEIVINK